MQRPLQDCIIWFFVPFCINRRKKTDRKFGRLNKSPYLCTAIEKNSCPDGGIGRRAGLKHQWSNIHPGSTPGLGTNKAK